MSAPATDPVDALIKRLDVVRDGSGWAAPCPAHRDRARSLAVRRDPGGRAVVRCGMGCAEDAVWSALGLAAPHRPRGVWRVSGAEIERGAEPEHEQAADDAEPDRDPGAPDPPERNAPRWQVEPLTDPHDGVLLPAIHALIAPYLERARAHGPTPPLRSEAWLDAHPDQQLAHLLLCGVDRVLFDPRALVADLIKQAGQDVAGSAGAEFAARSARLRDQSRAPMRGATGRCWRCGCIEQHHNPGTGGCPICGCPGPHTGTEGSR